MVRKDVGSGSQLDSGSLEQRLSNQQVGSGIGFPWSGKVFADPGLVIAQPVGDAQHFEVPLVTCAQTALRWMAGHHEQSELHSSFSLAATAASGPVVSLVYPT